LPSDAAGPIFSEAYDISGELEQVNLSELPILLLPQWMAGAT